MILMKDKLELEDFKGVFGDKVVSYEGKVESRSTRLLRGFIGISISYYEVGE